MRITKKQIRRDDSHFLHTLKEGFSYTFSFAPIRDILFLLALVSLMGMPYVTLMPVFAAEVLHRFASYNKDGEIFNAPLMLSGNKLSNGSKQMRVVNFSFGTF
jgi:hypothetical protein